ncbi:hypothetical protein NDU88_000919 [Pleurodeles waltl]|uniref:Ig-like domain-containing protein n=1 Tax=Pleurodeles waltl TaxID=8319 RepID=A0AAV7P5A2_PLEWA|nr:hypothetical protein NDU88_000919 [Pleurodeles waltl]
MLARVSAEVTLKCEANAEIKNLKWEKENSIILQWQKGVTFVFKGQSEMARSRSHLNMQQFNRGDCSMRIVQLEMSDAGLYTSTANIKEILRVQLVLFNMTSADSKALLVSDNLELLLVSNPATIPQDVSVTCRNPKDKERRAWRINRGQSLTQTLQVEDLQLEDSGDWKCKISTGKASLELSLEVTVAGFHSHDSGPTMLFSRINDTVLLSFVFNFNIRDPPTGFQPEVTSGGVYWSDDPAELGQQKTTLSVSQDGVCWSHECGQSSPGVRGSDLSFRLPRVQFDNAAWYTLVVRFAHKALKKKFHLTVLRVAASSKGPVAPESQVTLICEVSNHSSETVLRWTQVNGSLADTQEKKGAGRFRITLQMFPERFGLWQCSLYDGQKLLQTADFELGMWAVLSMRV